MAATPEQLDKLFEEWKASVMFSSVLLGLVNEAIQELRIHDQATADNLTQRLAVIGEEERQRAASSLASAKLDQIVINHALKHSGDDSAS